NAGAHRVNLLIASINRKLGPEAGFSGDSLDLYRPIVDFRNFQLKQLDDKTWVCARQDDFRPVRAVFDCFYITANPFPDLVFFCWHPLTIGEQSFIFAKVHTDIRTLKSPHNTADNITYAVLELGEDQLLLGPPDVLHQ